MANNITFFGMPTEEELAARKYVRGYGKSSFEKEKEKEAFDEIGAEDFDADAPDAYLSFAKRLFSISATAKAFGLSVQEILENTPDYRKTYAFALRSLSDIVFRAKNLGPSQIEALAGLEDRLRQLEHDEEENRDDALEQVFAALGTSNLENALTAISVLQSNAGVTPDDIRVTR